MTADEFPAGGSVFEDAGEAGAAVGAADGVEVDDGVMAVVGELGEGEAEDPGVGFRGVLGGFGVSAVFSRGAGVFGGAGIAFGEEDGVGLGDGDAEGFFEVVLFPVVGVAGEIGFFGEFVERLEVDGFVQVIF